MVLISEGPRSQSQDQSQSLNSSREEDETRDTTAPAGRRTISAPIERLTWLPRFMAFKKLSSPIPIAGTGPAVDSAAQERTLPRSSACQPGRNSRPSAAPNRQKPNCNIRCCFRNETMALACFLVFCRQLIALSHVGRAESSP